MLCYSSFCFFFNDTATTEIYTLSLHDALPISSCRGRGSAPSSCRRSRRPPRRTSPGAGYRRRARRDRKSTRLNSSHLVISYAVFCLKKKTTIIDDAVMQHEMSQSRIDVTHEYC